VSLLGRGDDLAHAAAGVDVLILAVPDAAIAAVARSIEPSGPTLVLHLSGSVDLEALRPHGRRAGMHPLVPLPDAERGAALLRGAWFAIEGDDGVCDVTDALEGRVVRIASADRARYHLAAVVASNHLVALMGHVERLAADVGMPLDAFVDLARASLDNVAALGPARALTGPVARGDWDTIRRHLDVLDTVDRPAYLALAAEAARLSGVELPSDVLSKQTGPPSGPVRSRAEGVPAWS
jgi:predicted short-subunit dehydrogenase-like oxidoreductase (DUF2520 family)